MPHIQVDTYILQETLLTSTNYTIYIYICTYKEGKMYMKPIMLNVPLVMSDALDEIAKRENKPRSYIMREMLDQGIRERQKDKQNESK